jgi:hypothetical protein
MVAPALQKAAHAFCRVWGAAVQGQCKGSTQLQCALLRSTAGDKDKKLKKEHKLEHSAALHALGHVTSGKYSCEATLSNACRVAAVPVALASRSALGVPPVPCSWIEAQGEAALALLLLSSTRTLQAEWEREFIHEA